MKTKTKTKTKETETSTIHNHKGRNSRRIQKILARRKNISLNLFSAEIIN